LFFFELYRLFVKINQMLAKLVKFGELCWIFDFGRFQGCFLRQKRRTPGVYRGDGWGLVQRRVAAGGQLADVETGEKKRWRPFSCKI
jgi:hypothetical protein